MNGRTASVFIETASTQPHHIIPFDDRCQPPAREITRIGAFCRQRSDIDHRQALQLALIESLAVQEEGRGVLRSRWE